MGETVEERWVEKCDLCRTANESGRCWGWEHCGGFTFTWCPTCAKNLEGTANLMTEQIGKWMAHGREYWATHPEELAKHHKETEEYRMTLTKEEWARGSKEIRDEFFRTHPDHYEKVYGKSWFKRFLDWFKF